MKPINSIKSLCIRVPMLLCSNAIARENAAQVTIDGLEPAPDTPSTNTTPNITESAGDVTLYPELRDSVTGDLLVKALDFQFDRSNITPHMMDRTRNERAARRILANCTQLPVKGLRVAKVSTSGRL